MRKVLFLATAMIVLAAGSAMAWDTPTAFGGYHILERANGSYFSHIQATLVSGSLFDNPAAVVRLDTINPNRVDESAHYGAITTDWTTWTNGDGTRFTLDTPNTATYKSIYEDWYFVGAMQETVFDMTVWNGNTCIGAHRITAGGQGLLKSVNLATAQQTRFDAQAVPEPPAILLALGVLGPAAIMFKRRKA